MNMRRRKISGIEKTAKSENWEEIFILFSRDKNKKIPKENHKELDVIFLKTISHELNFIFEEVVYV